ncbi:hypothetical protein FACS1894176_07180 [Bacteroidia bacterium]|nr:hypothetical protein FACS1894176_07180 [Bacteroidia bacterium]
MPETPTQNTRDNYLPSSAEKKQAVMMYLFVGLLLSLQQQDVSPYMHHHIKQSMGWVVLLVLTIFLDVILFIFGILLGKFFSIIGGIITIPVLILGIVCIKQAYDGKYQWDSNGAVKFFSGFAGLGSWILNLFDADHYQSKIGLENPQQIPTNSSTPEIDLTQYEIGKQ